MRPTDAPLEVGAEEREALLEGVREARVRPDIRNCKPRSAP